MTDDLKFVGVAVGNTRTRVGVLKSGEVEDGISVANDRPEEIVSECAKRDLGVRGIALATVNKPLADQLESLLGDAGQTVYRVGRDITIPIQNALEDDSTVGQDRLLCALGAFSKSKQACIVIDAGTAITVDFVDGTGVFQGGAIAPGIAMMFRSLHSGTAALPELAAMHPDPARGVFGKDTRHAMQLGVRAAAVGSVHHLIDRYAEVYGGYPQVVATGGDSRALFESDDLVEHIVPDLQLIGLAIACRLALSDHETDDELDDEDE
jgi:type III pantothenate kinase